MKRFTLTLALILVSITMYGQGIAVQGIARNAQKSAITNEQRQFTFTISGTNSPQYRETQNITTDAFGVFSHIVGTGTPQASSNNFDELNFAEQLTLAVEVQGVGEVYKKEFKHTPYAHYAMNGVPVGTVVAYAGNINNATPVPKGWLWCNGDAIPNETKYNRLKAILGGSNTPDLRGRFLRGAETGAGMTSIDPVDVRKYQSDQIKAHKHGVGTLRTSPAGRHKHSLPQSVTTDNENTADARAGNGGDGHASHIKETNEAGEHTHAITGNTANTGGTETRPYNYGVHYIIKY